MLSHFCMINCKLYFRQQCDNWTTVVALLVKSVVKPILSKGTPALSSDLPSIFSFISCPFFSFTHFKFSFLLFLYDRGLLKQKNVHTGIHV